MLYSIRVKNFYSIGKEQVMDFTSPGDDDASVIKTKFGYVNKIISVVGNNASGKTNFLRVITFLHWLANKSFMDKDDSSLAYYKHFMHEDEPSEIDVVFQASNNLFKLEFKFDDDIIFYEKLSIKKKPSDRFAQVYKVERYDNEYHTSYSEFWGPLSRDDRSNVKESPCASLFSYLCLTRKLKDLGITNGISLGYRSNLRNCGVPEVDFTETCKSLSDFFLKPANADLKDATIDVLKTMDLGIKDFSDKILFVINSKTGHNSDKIMSLVHGNKKNSFDVPLILESEGTVESMNLFLPLLEIILKDGTFVIDEIEKSKHPLIIKKFISYFLNNDTKGQLIFSTHMPMLLENRNKSQIMFVEKTDCVNSEIYRLDELKNVRNEENFAVKYMTGKYGAIPRKGVDPCVVE